MQLTKSQSHVSKDCCLYFNQTALNLKKFTSTKIFSSCFWIMITILLFYLVTEKSLNQIWWEIHAKEGHSQVHHIKYHERVSQSNVIQSQKTTNNTLLAKWNYTHYSKAFWFQAVLQCCAVILCCEKLKMLLCNIFAWSIVI